MTESLTRRDFLGGAIAAAGAGILLTSGETAAAAEATAEPLSSAQMEAEFAQLITAMTPIERAELNRLMAALLRWHRFTETGEAMDATATYEQMLGSADSYEQTHAKRARRALADAHVYPAADLGGNASFDVYAANCRAALRAAVDELDRTDLVATWRLVRLLILVPRDPELFRFMAQCSAIDLAYGGIDPRTCFDLDELELEHLVEVLPDVESGQAEA